MLKIKIGNRGYNIPTHWDEVTLAQCVDLLARVEAEPQEVRDYFLSFATEAEAAKMDSATLSFSIAALVELTKIPRWMVKKFAPEHLERLIASVLPRFVCGVLGRVDYTACGARSFRQGWCRYQYPHAGVDVAGISTHLSELSAAELCQVSDIVQMGTIALAPLAVALCCRPRGEAYNETKAQRRAAHFAALPASVYWELWARVSAAHSYLRECYPSVYGKSGEASESTDGATLWGDRLVATAIGSPTSIEYLQGMNGYDFVHLLSESIKKQTDEWKMKAALSGLGLR